MRLPIVAGPLRGRWWLPASRGKLLRILGGTYEPEHTAALQQWIGPSATVLDVGAHVGYYTLLASLLVGPRGRVIAFEPDPRNCEFLRRHARLNGCTNVEVEQAAAAATTGTARFEFGSGSGTGHLAEAGALEVRTMRIDDFCQARELVPSAIKIDVEGAELQVLQGAEATLRTARPVIFLSTHGAGVHAACLEWLRERGYAVEAIGAAPVLGAAEVLCLPDER